MSSVHLQGKPFNITIIQSCTPNTDDEEVEVDWFYEDLQDLLELTPKKRCPFHLRVLDAKVGSQQIPGVTGKFGLGIQDQENTGHSKHLLQITQETVLPTDIIK